MPKAATSTAPLCQLPGCNNPVEQPPGGGPRKRFCCDQHRLQYWRQSQRDGKDPEPGASGADTGPPALALKAQLEQSLTTLEAIVMRTRTTLIELSSLEEAEAVRKEAFAIAEEQVARAQAERAAEERRRQTAESLAEAATSAAREAEEQLNASNARLVTVEGEVESLRQALEAQTERSHQEVEAAKAQAQQANDKLLKEIRSEIALRAKAEARTESAEARIEELKDELAQLRVEPTRSALSQKPAAKKASKTKK